jgi:hypothetical protein
MFNLLSSRRARIVIVASLLLSSVSSAHAELITMADQAVSQYKSITISNFSSGVPIVGENSSAYALPEDTSFNDDWIDSATYAGVTVAGNASLAYTFTSDEISFSSNVSTSHTGTSSQDITAVPRGGSSLNVSFILNQAAYVFFDITASTDNNGTGGLGGNPSSSGLLSKYTGLNDSYGDKKYVDAFARTSSSDSSIGNGGLTVNNTGSELLEAGEYRLVGSTGVQNLYYQRFGGTSSSAQSSELDISLRFEAVQAASVTGPSALLAMVPLLLLGLLRRRQPAQLASK